jgi:hypothetical protein
MRAPMPHIINPHRTRLIRLSIRINPLLPQPPLKHRITQPQISAAPVIKRVVRGRYIIMSPAQLPRIQRQYARRKPTVRRALQQRPRKLVVVRHVELEEPHAAFFPPCARVIGPPDVFNRLAARRAETIRQSQFAGDSSEGQFAVRVVDFINPEGREADGRRYLVPEYVRCRVALVRVDEHAGHDAVAVEGLAVRCVRVRETGV